MSMSKVEHKITHTTTIWHSLPSGSLTVYQNRIHPQTTFNIKSALEAWNKQASTCRHDAADRRFMCGIDNLKENKEKTANQPTLTKQTRLLDWANFAKRTSASRQQLVFHEHRSNTMPRPRRNMLSLLNIRTRQCWKANFRTTHLAQAEKQRNETLLLFTHPSGVCFTKLDP